MAVGSGLSATLGIATESTVGTPVAVTRFVELNSESVQMKKHIAQGSGVRGGALGRRSARRNNVAREAQGDINFDIPTNGFGLWLQHMLGSFSTTATSLGGGLYQQIHNTGSLQGKSFTMQKLVPDTTGVTTQEAFTYTGCKITGWEISTQQAQQLQVKVTIDALDEATTTNAFAATTLASLSTVGATSISTVASIPVGSYIVIGTGATAEVAKTSAVSGTGPYTVTVPALAQAHASGAYVGSATGVNYGSAAGLQAASYTAGTSMWDFSQAAIVAGGVTSVVTNVWTLTGGSTVANVRSITIKGSNPLKTDRWGAGSAIRSEQLENNFRDISVSATVEYNGRAYYDAYAADLPLALKFTATSPTGAILQVFLPIGYIEDGATPQIAGPDVVMQSLNFTNLDDGTNGFMQAIYTSTDSTV